MTCIGEITDKRQGLAVLDARGKSRPAAKDGLSAFLEKQCKRKQAVDLLGSRRHG